MKLRFRNKRYGYGWVPITRQGRAVVGLYAIGLVLNFYRIDTFSHSASDTLIAFVPQVVILTLFLLIIARVTGEKPERRRGPKKK